MSKRAPKSRTSEGLIPLDLSGAEIEILRRVVHYYERSMGVTRHVIRLTAGAEVKAKYRFIVDESKWLEKTVDAAYHQLADSGDGTVLVCLTPRAGVALWGRLLSSINVPRSRRKLSQKEADARQALAGRVGSAMRTLHDETPSIIQHEVATRRAREVDWMQAFLTRQTT